MVWMKFGRRTVIVSMVIFFTLEHEMHAKEVQANDDSYNIAKDGEV